MQNNGHISTLAEIFLNYHSYCSQNQTKQSCKIGVLFIIPCSQGCGPRRKLVCGAGELVRKTIDILKLV